uniref:Retrovirus-related Pol polyprotein from transposon TNT 1-94 n=1 Tax=Tanacetum cinerariifolium TaxID=118510 RepID=A0A6L2NMP7_TANCI|nr:retrovirus-related Pol polyprotein from transposon TNT 1-94 [Tanacetum cinerariifolium]
MPIEDYLYQQKLHEPLAEAKPTGMKAEDWTLLDRQPLGVVKLSLAKNATYNVSMRRLHTACLRLCLICTVTAVSGSTGTTKLKFDNILDLILGEDIRKKTSREYPNSLLSVEDKGIGRKQDRGQKQNRASKDKEVHMAVKDYDDEFVCCVENTINDRIMDSSASFHATYCKEELERFKLCSDKVRLADEKTLDIANVGDVVLKTSFARGNKCGSMYMVEVPSNGINAVIDGRGNATLWPQRLRHMSEKGIKILASNQRIPDLQKAVVGFYEPCVLRKQKKVSFVEFENIRKLQRLKLVHTYVYGPTSVASIGGSRYYVTFIDDNNSGSLDMSEKSKNSGSFEDSGRLDKEDSQDGAFSEEEGFETLQGTLRLSQENYIGKVLEKFNMKDAEARCHPLGDHFKLSKKQAPKMKASRQRMAKIPYALVVGSVMYTIVCTRLDIAHAVGVVSRFMSNPGREHWEVVKWMVHYLKGTSKDTLCFSRKVVVLEGFFDSDYGAKYMDIALADKKLIWLKNYLEELDRAQTEGVLFCDNESAIHLAKNPVLHGSSGIDKNNEKKYIDCDESLVFLDSISRRPTLGSRIVEVEAPSVYSRFCLEFGYVKVGYNFEYDILQSSVFDVQYGVFELRTTAYPSLDHIRRIQTSKYGVSIFDHDTAYSTY